MAVAGPRWAVFLVFSVTVVSRTSCLLPARPTYPEYFTSVWNYTQSYPSGPAAQGPIIWESNGTAMYYNMKPIGLEQLLIGSKSEFGRHATGHTVTSHHVVQCCAA